MLTLNGTKKKRGGKGWWEQAERSDGWRSTTKTGGVVLKKDKFELLQFCKSARGLAELQQLKFVFFEHNTPCFRRTPPSVTPFCLLPPTFPPSLFFRSIQRQHASAQLLSIRNTHTHILSRRHREKSKTTRKERLARGTTSMRLNEDEKEAPPCSADARLPAARSSHTHTHTLSNRRREKRKKHAEKRGWPERRQACNGMKTKNELRQARRTCSPLQQPAARTGASCRAAILGPTQRMLGRPGGKHENGRPTRKWQLHAITNKNARDDRASVLRKVENNDARGKKKTPR